MQVWPAIDLRGGKCVRLQQGDYGRETIFGDDPAAMARQFVDDGAECLHLVDLDGAKAGRPANIESVRSILKAVRVPCELGGGIRDEDTIASLLELGLSRLVIGTKALREPDWFQKLCRRFPNRLVLGIDARDGRVATDGWLETSNTSAIDLAKQFDAEPRRRIDLHRYRDGRHARRPQRTGDARDAAGRPHSGNCLRRRHDGRRTWRASPRQVSQAASSADRCTKDGSPSDDALAAAAAQTT